MELLVVAKAPVAGRVKTRLCPPCSPEQAAHVAEAALVDTLATATAAGFDRVVLSLEGHPGQWLPAGTIVVAQRGDGFAQRLECAWQEVRGPALQIGMDTPQLRPADLQAAAAALTDVALGVDAVIGPACDGGWYLLGLQRPLAGAFRHVPMSTPDTGRRQVARLRRLGLVVGASLPVERDVDSWDDALAVAATAPPGGTFPAAVARVAATLPHARRRERAAP